MSKLLAGLCFWMTAQCFAAAAPNSTPAPVDITGIRFLTSPNHTQVVLDTNGPLWHKLYLLKNPDRLVIDLLRARVAGSLWPYDLSGSFVNGLRTGITMRDELRIVLDLKRGVHLRSFNLKPKWHYGHRLVINLSTNNEAPRSNKFRVANTGMYMGAYGNSIWLHPFRLFIDQAPKEETANIFRVANIDSDMGAYSMGSALNDGIKGGMAGGILGWLLVLIRSGIGLKRKRLAEKLGYE